MGKIMVRIKVGNLGDLVLARRGLLAPELVRSVELDALVDTGATTLALPADVGERLGLQVEGKRKVRYADGRTGEIPWVSGVRLEILGRVMTCDALLEATGTTALIGQIPLGALDLVIDPKSRDLAVSPASPDMPLLDLLAVSWAAAALPRPALRLLFD
jgi:clan AA aspartic protease